MSHVSVNSMLLFIFTCVLSNYKNINNKKYIKINDLHVNCNIENTSLKRNV